MQQIMLICRPGFETEAGQELTDQAAAAGIFGFFQPGKNTGLLRFTIGGNEPAEELMRRVALEELVFTRDWFAVLGDCELPVQDRVGAILAFMNDQGWQGNRCARLEVRLPETNDDRDLGNFARKWVAPPVEGAARGRPAERRPRGSGTGAAGNPAGRLYHRRGGLQPDRQPGTLCWRDTPVAAAGVGPQPLGAEA